MTDRRAIGFRCHSGWAALVVVSGSSTAPMVFERRRVELVDTSLPRQPFHGVAERGMPGTVVDAVAHAANTAAVRAIQSVARADAVGVVASERRVPENLDEILASHALLHAAEGQLFELAVIDAAHDAGLLVHVVEPRSIQVPAAVEGLRRSIGGPWQKDHKWATTAALAALVSV